MFGLVNGLAHNGLLAPADAEFRTVNNEWFQRNLPIPTVYCRTRYPLAAAWFRTSATVFLERVPGYLRILRTHGIPCETVWSNDPGILVYEDEYQVVVAPASGDR